MLTPKITLTFTSVGRTNKITRINYVNEFSFVTDYDTLISTGKIILPANKLYAANNKLEGLAESINKTKNGELINLTVRDYAFRGYDNELVYNLITPIEMIQNPEKLLVKEPIFAIGDLVTTQITYLNPHTNKPEPGREMFTITSIITGLKLEDKLEIEIANIGYLFKSIIFPNMVINGEAELVSIIKDRLAETVKKYPQIIKINDFMVDSLKFNSQMIVTGNLSFAQFLNNLKEKYNLLPYFINDTFVWPYLTQVQKDYTDKYLLNDEKNSILKEQAKIFRMNGYKDKTKQINANIINRNNLQYKTTDNVKLSAIVSNTYDTEAGGITKDGYAKTKKKKISVYIEFDKKNNDLLNSIKDGKIKLNQIKNLSENIVILYGNDGKRTGNEIDSKGIQKEDGERRTFVDPSSKNTNDLIIFGLQELQKYYYNGYRGDFETFGEPVTFIGDIIELQDISHPEKNGFYRVKGVETSFGSGGYRQKITLDIKVQNKE
jgi:hypothetical protein